MEAEELTERITLPVGWGITAAAIAPVLAAGSGGTASPSESLQSQAVYSMPTETKGTSKRWERLQGVSRQSHD